MTAKDFNFLKHARSFFPYQPGMFYWKVKGDADRGRQHLERSLRLDPDQQNRAAIRALLGQGLQFDRQRSVGTALALYVARR